MGKAPKNAQEPVLPEVMSGRKRVIPFDTRCEIVRYYDSLPKDGSKGAYLRRNGLFKSSVNQWRSDMNSGVETAAKRGRKAVDPSVREMARLRADNKRLERELEKANAVIDVQKKVSALLEMHLDNRGQAS
jgi:hypothetical protein